MAEHDAVHVLTEQDLNRLQLSTLQYYLHEANPENGLIRDKTEKTAPASIAAVGLALASVPILVERRIDSFSVASLRFAKVFCEVKQHRRKDSDRRLHAA
jgi:hypothetical protein